MQLGVKKTLSEIAIFTAIPADLLAIIPAISRLFSKKFSWSQTVQIEEIELPSLSITVGRDLFIVLITYAVIAFIYWLVVNIKSRSGKQKYNFLRMFAISIPLTFVIPFITVLMAFGSIEVMTGFSVLLVCIFTSIICFMRWGDNKAIVYRDIGFWYLAWVPLIWLLFQYRDDTSWLVNLGVAWIYSAVGYLFSVLMSGATIALFIIPTSHLGLSDRTLEIFLKFYLFNFDQGWSVLGTLGTLVLIGLIALLVWILKILIPIIIGALILVGIGVAWYFSEKYS